MLKPAETRKVRFLPLAALLCCLCAAALAAVPAAPPTAGKAPPASPSRVSPPDTMVLSGIPDVPVELKERAARYTENRYARLSDWHPTRREMLIMTRLADTQQLHHLRMPGGARRQLTFFPDRVSRGSFRKGDGGLIVFAKDTAGSEFDQLYSFDPATTEIVLLTDGKSRNTGALFSNRGKLLAYNSTRRNGKDTDFYVIDPSIPKSDRLLAQVEGGGWSVLDWSPDDRTLLVEEELSVNESYMWLIDVESGKMTPLIERRKTDPRKDPFALRADEEKVAYSGGRFAPDGKGVYVATDRESEYKRLAYVDIATRRHDYLTTSIKWDIDDFDLSSDGRWLAYVVNEDGVGVLHLLDMKTKRERALPRLPQGSVLGVRWHDNSRDLGFHLVSARSPLDIYSLDVVSGKVERWTESETAITTAALPEPKLVRWKSFDGRMISGFLYQPPPRFEGRRPVMINIHGGPEAQARPTFLGQNNYLLNELGVAIIYPNVRGSQGYGKSFMKLDNGELREDSVKDIGALLSYIEKRPDLDKDRVMVAGGSYGGYMSLAVSVMYADRIRCAIDIVGISNFVTFLERTESYRQDLRRVEYGDERDPKMRELLTRISPLSNADRIRKPLFVVQGRNDPRVPYTEAEQIVATLKKNGTPVWYLLANDEGHGFAKKKNSDFLFYSMVLFIKQYLLG